MMDMGEAQWETLPPLYQGWLRDILSSPIPREARATCAACAMCTPDAALRAAYRFNADAKCCTYSPELRNFSVGAILGASGVASSTVGVQLRERIANGVGVTPLGISPLPSVALLFRRSQETGQRTFGRARAMRCSYFIEERGGECGIWAERNAVCATFFCKHNRGATGSAFWDDVRELLTRVETELALWAAVTTGIDVSGTRACLAPVSASELHSLRAEMVADGAARPAARVWGRWSGHEIAFYQECARLVRELTWTDVASIGGHRVAVLSDLVRSSFQALTVPVVPGRLRHHRLTTESVDSTSVKVDTHSLFDALLVPRAVLDLLPYFDGRPTLDAVSNIATEQGIEVTADLLQSLVDFQVLDGAP